MNKPFTLIRWERWGEETFVWPTKYAKEKNAIRRATEEIMWESTERVIVIDKRTGATVFNEPGTFV